jgi:hypothetical protein
MAARAQGSEKIVVNVSPEQAYDVVSDVTRTGEWSPECVRVEWIEPGTRFVGHNKDGDREWLMECVVDEAARPTAFSWHTERPGKPGEARTQWGYRFAPAAGGTEITEWYARVAQAPLLARIVERFVMGGREKHNAENMRKSLERLKEVIESSSA